MAKILRVPDVLARIGMSRSTLYEWVRTGNFPPVRQARGAGGWMA